jgi:hypothetical protein
MAAHGVAGSVGVAAFDRDQDGVVLLDVLGQQLRVGLERAPGQAAGEGLVEVADRAAQALVARRGLDRLVELVVRARPGAGLGIADCAAEERLGLASSPAASASASGWRAR